MKRKWLLVLGASTFGGLLAWCCLDAFVFRSVAPHQGDGEFENLSRRFGPFALSGYGIDMPEFDLGKPFEGEYKVAGLARLHRRCGVYLATRDARFDRSAKGGNLRLEVTDSTGQSLVAVSGDLHSYICWSQYSRDSEIHGFYRLEDSFFFPNPHETYRIKVSYAPCPSLVQYKGFVHLRCGGKL